MKWKFFIVILTLITHLFFDISAEGTLRVARCFSNSEFCTAVYTSFCMDAKGFMWIGTDNGLIRFDGSFCKQYRHSESDVHSISDNRILGLLRDASDRMWVATADGLNLYDEFNDSFHRISVPDFGQYGYIISMASDRYGHLIFVVAGVGIFSLTVGIDNDITIREIVRGDHNRDVNCILATPDGSLYAGTQEGRIYEILSGKNWIELADVGNAVTEMGMDSAGALIIAAYHGLFRLLPAERIVERLVFPSDIRINKLSGAVGDDIYVATSGAGLWRVTCGENQASHCSDIHSPSFDMDKSRIGAVYSSPDGSLWIGCNYKGVLILAGGGDCFIYRRIDSVFPGFDSPVSAMAIWNGNTVVGNLEGKVGVFNEEGSAVMEVNMPGNIPVSSVAVTSNGKALIGLIGKGIIELDLRTGVLRDKIDIPGKFISVHACASRDGDIYVGVHGVGMYKIDSVSGERTWISPDPSGRHMFSPFINSLSMKGDSLWIGSYGGLACYNTSSGSFNDIDTTTFAVGTVFAVAPENRHSVLIGTSRGLIRYDPETRKSLKYTTIDGLPDNDVRSIVIDGNGGKWIGTMGGLSYLNSSGDGFTSFPGGNGLVENTFEELLYSPETDRVYARGRVGTLSFIPDSVFVSEFRSPVRITGVYLNGKEIAPSEMMDGRIIIDGGSLFPETIRLPHYENSLSLRLSTMDFRDISGIRYSWRLDKDRNWIELPLGMDMIFLPSLSPGDHVLEFKAEEAGVESSVSGIRIEVYPPWYLTWWAKMVYILVFLAMLSMGLELLRKRQQERLKERRLAFFMEISKDMLSPLSMIVSPLESMLNLPLPVEIRRHIRMAYRNTYRIIILLNQLIDLKNIGDGIKSLECRNTDLPVFIGEIVDMFQPQAAGKRIALSFTVIGHWSEVWIDRTIIDRIMVNLISFGIRNLREDGTIDIVLTQTNDDDLGECLEIKLMEKGIGSMSESFQHIFCRNDRTRSGKITECRQGIDLELCRRYVGLHRGIITLDSADGDSKERVISIIIPLEVDGCRQKEELSDISFEDFVPIGIETAFPEIKGNDEVLMQRVNKIIAEKIYDEDFNVDRLAEEVGVSRSHLYRRFKDRVGVNPSDYIRNIRLRRACELLMNDDLDITQIAYALGFSSQSQFSNTFKRFIGISPKEYRQKHFRNDNDVD